MRLVVAAESPAGARAHSPTAGDAAPPPVAAAVAGRARGAADTRPNPHTHYTPKNIIRFDAFNPFVSCPPGQPLRRYGNGGDGGKVLCDLAALRPPCLIYSLGSNGDYSFEQDMLRRTRCHVHTFDCTYAGRSIDAARHTYHKVLFCCCCFVFCCFILVLPPCLLFFVLARNLTLPRSLLQQKSNNQKGVRRRRAAAHAVQALGRAHRGPRPHAHRPAQG